jgi:hypothetical protein
MLYVEE